MEAARKQMRTREATEICRSGPGREGFRAEADAAGAHADGIRCEVFAAGAPLPVPWSIPFPSSAGSCSPLLLSPPMFFTPPSQAAPLSRVPSPAPRLLSD